MIMLLSHSDTILSLMIYTAGRLYIEPEIKTSDGSTLEIVNEFTYLGSQVSSSKADIKRRIALAWTSANKLQKIWKSSLSKNFKINIFRATVETVLLYGCETWTITKELEKKLNGCYTRLLRYILGYTWKDRINNETLYNDIPKVSAKIQQRRLKLVGHCLRHKEEMAHNLIFWTPNHGRRSRGRPDMTYVQQIENDTKLSVGEMKVLAMDRKSWRILAGRGIPPRPK